MKKLKIRIKSPEHSKMVQEKLFEMGCGWSDGLDVRYTDKPFLFVGTFMENCITFIGLVEDYFNRHPLPEVELIEKIEYEFKEIPKKNVVKVGEFSYYEEDLAEALKNIKPI